ncbi:TetR/AcrR family transcriptional regulator [Nocardioides sp. InS609-2]|uniref:TetR/AcrR family transcriptional regulator n=1 Tax=Nocardioides sp. InS609-2 TaxID=2760705 RepID=UPI0020C0F965|nr:TetR/AcrR family transcriptional regulator [Nocardioides sp. InS609-2]
MTSENPTDAPGARRARVREAALLEIKQAAREHLLRYGPGELSLRAVARDVGVTPSALYRYFDSRGALVAALSADALESAAKAVSSASSDEALRPVERLRAMFVAMRAWTHTHRSEFELIFANRDEQTRPDMARSEEMQRLVSLPLAAAMAALADGSIAPSVSQPTLSADAVAAVQALPVDIDQELFGQAMLVCTNCFGWLYLEHFGIVTWAVDEGDAAFASHLDGVLGARP